MNLRGRIVPVVSLRARFGHPDRPPDPADHFIVARAVGRLVALRVDRALDLVRLAEDDLEDLRGAVSGGAGVRRVAKLPGQMVLIHDDLDALLSQVEVEHAQGLQPLGFGAPIPAAGGEHG